MGKKKEKLFKIDISAARVDEIYNERYGGESWKQILERQPDRAVDLRDFVSMELELQEVQALIAEIREKQGSASANLGLTDNGLPCIAPLQQLLRAKRSQKLAMRRALRDILDDNLAGDDDDNPMAEFDKYDQEEDEEEEEEDDDDGFDEDDEDDEGNKES